jgi:hypothetical protein
MTTKPSARRCLPTFYEVYTVQPGLSWQPAAHEDKGFVFRFLRPCSNMTAGCEVGYEN